MRPLFSADFLEIWERGSGLHPIDRCLVVLHAVAPETPYESLSDWPLGRRNQALAEIRCSSFGRRLEAWTACARCGEKLEFQLDARALSAPRFPHPSQITIEGRPFRLPTSRDLALAARERDPRIGAIRIVEACCGLDESETVPWSDQDLDEIGDQMALADPWAETRLTLKCSSCGNEWEENLDIGAFLWTEITSQAQRLLRDVHTLASAYGWSEAEILALSDARRERYLEMCP
jgi:hypothetical protein